jgi:hypothetical protein
MNGFKKLVEEVGLNITLQAGAVGVSCAVNDAYP